jgi:uncharacterized protein (DUF2384 family)
VQRSANLQICKRPKDRPENCILCRKLCNNNNLYNTEDRPKANRWLRDNLVILDGKPPLEIARTESGARVVEQMLAKIDWGAAA